MRLLMYGAGDFARTVEILARDCGHEVLGCIDDTAQNPHALGTFSAVCESHPPADCGVVMAIGYRDLGSRWKAWLRLRAAGYASPALIHPRAYVAAQAVLADGCQVMAGAVVDVRSSVGEASVLWPCANVNHDSRVGANCFVSPSATLCGFVQIGDGSFIGAGAVVVDHCVVPPHSFIKAASLTRGPRQ
ncbi:MAG: hypothetical protein IV092_07285 [Burkholderiaceae bacterium]|nr:hypothetical protein [Burkholderiaceae bacterium]